MQHKGLSFVDILQPCPTYNDINTKEWYNGEDRVEPKTGKPQSRLYKLDETGFDPKVKDWADDFGRKMAALDKAREWGDKIPVGVFYKNDLESTLVERIIERIPFYLSDPPCKQRISDENGKPTTDISGFFEELKTS
jgi:2-oxoglutarate ferredoxin oxidoreductase subunit beta